MAIAGKITELRRLLNLPRANRRHGGFRRKYEYDRVAVENHFGEAGLPSLAPGDALQIYYCAIAEGLQRNSKLLAEFEAVMARVGDKDAELVALTLARSHIHAPPSKSLPT